MSTVTVVIPALNEQRRIGSTLDTVLEVAASQPRLQLEILVVDDGSTDNTADVVTGYTSRHSTVRLIRHPVNRGLGQALRTALAEATGDKLLLVPGDNDMPAETIAALLAHADRADMVMCYFPARAQRGPARRLLSALFGLAYAICFDFVVEYINGPCVYPLARLRELQLVSTRFSIVAEINVKLLRQGVSFIEIPGRRQVGLEGSKSLSWRNLAETLRVFCQVWWQVHVSERTRFGLRPRRVQAVSPIVAGHG